MEVRLIDLIREVQDASDDDCEAVAALEHLLNSAPEQPRRLRDLVVAIALTLVLTLGAGASNADEETPPPVNPPPEKVETPTPPPPAADTPTSAEEEATGVTFLPSRALFDPLIADVRWPRFSAEYQGYHDDPTLHSVGAANFGGMLPVIQGPFVWEGRWEVGAQAGVFSIFDLNADSHDLINADYWFGLPFSARWGWFSVLFRVYHQSSHLGDEFLLRTGTNRVNLSYEAVDIMPSIELWSWGRVYGGYGYLYSREPSDLKPAYWQLGGELKSPIAFWGWLRPIAGLDLKRTQEQSWSTDYSARLGVQFENEKVFKARRLLLLGEYYKGHSPNGQFFDNAIEFWGVGLHYFF
ncbi:MAG TPA: DUF1207 domain-containing protein [Myxococcota bacterium]|nr:DUF1207 domain-containing protein [Myxococcota bacterium]